MISGGFYRHLYEQKLGSDDKEEIEKIKENPVSKDTEDENNKTDKLEAKKRNYRKRKTSSDIKRQLSEGEIDESDEEIKHLNLKDISLAKKSKQSEVNIDADSDFSIDESSDDENSDKKKTAEVKQSTDEESKLATTDDTIESAKPDVKSNTEKDEKVKEEKQAIVEPKPKIDIWKKRTVGEVFAQALKRYYERKAARGI